MLSAFGIDHGEFSKGVLKPINTANFARGGSNAIQDAKAARLTAINGPTKQVAPKSITPRSPDANKMAGTNLIRSKLKGFGASRAGGR